LLGNEDKKILVCPHEPNNIFDDIKKLGLVVERYPLKAGDYAIGEILIERKDIDDYCTSLNSGRLFKQLWKMKQTGKKNLLVVIGTVPRSLKMFLMELERQGVTGDDYDIARIKYMEDFNRRLVEMRDSLFISFGVLLVRLTTEQDFINYIEHMWIRSNKHTYAPAVEKKDNPMAIKIDIISRIPSVGGSVAKELAAKFTIRQLMDMPIEELSAIMVNGRKIGVKGQRIKEVLNL
jgi:ERCC4-type nuclease